MVGGDEKVVEYVKPILEEISSKFTYFGESGSGQIVKMINQIIVLNNYTILAEAASLHKLGILMQTKFQKHSLMVMQALIY